MMLPGSYFIDVSVSGIVEDSRTVLCKINDEYAFKVLDGEYSKYSGLVYLKQNFGYKLVSTNNHHSNNTQKLHSDLIGHNE